MRTWIAKRLVLVLLALSPSMAFAQRGVGPLMGQAAWDFLCLTDVPP